jgi:ankyrin repeat protein
LADMPVQELLVKEDSTTLGASPSKKYTVVKLQCTHTNLSKFRGPEDPSFLEVKRIIKEQIDFTTTRRFWNSISKGNEEDVKKQLAQGAKFNKANSRKQNSLHLATIAGRLEIVTLLLDRGVAVNAKDLDKHGPVRYALKGSKYEILKALLKRGARVADKEKEGITDEKCLKLLADIRYFQGPRVNPKTQESLPAFPKDKLPLECDLDKYMGTITTFHLRSAKDTEEEIQNNISTSSADSKVAVEDETEYHWREKVTVGKMLFEESDEDAKGTVTSDKQWKWYHLPANNVSSLVKWACKYTDNFLKLDWVEVRILFYGRA